MQIALLFIFFARQVFMWLVRLKLALLLKMQLADARYIFGKVGFVLWDRIIAMHTRTFSDRQLLNSTVLGFTF